MWLFYQTEMSWYQKEKLTEITIMIQQVFFHVSYFISNLIWKVCMDFRTSFFWDELSYHFIEIYILLEWHAWHLILVVNFKGFRVAIETNLWASLQANLSIEFVDAGRTALNIGSTIPQARIRDLIKKSGGGGENQFEYKHSSLSLWFMTGDVAQSSILHSCHHDGPCPLKLWDRMSPSSPKLLPLG